MEEHALGQDQESQALLMRVYRIETKACSRSIPRPVVVIRYFQKYQYGQDAFEIEDLLSFPKP